MSTLPILNKGDIVDVIAPASKSTTKIFKDSISWLEEQGFKPRFDKKIISGDGFFASNEELQWQQLKNALISKDSKAIWCLRGGWGSMRFIPQLTKLKKPNNNKLFVGFSDITTLHLFLNQEWNWKTIHGSNLSAFGAGATKVHQKKYLNLIQGKEDQSIYKSLKSFGDSHTKLIKGKLVGGNLCMLATSIGTKCQANLNNKIVFLEEVGERGYRVDRMFEQLIQSGVFNNKIKAIVLGDFTESREPNGKDLTSKAIKRLQERLNVPIFKGLKSGHGKSNNPLVFNSMATIDPKKKSLILDF
ncbi:MAG: LD-carboxypeptidase [Bacteriovoracaceae bacterium]|nr:LD-carboxypeptidase [Bacteriovoracaceae bacterium]